MNWYLIIGLPIAALLFAALISVVWSAIALDIGINRRNKARDVVVVIPDGAIVEELSTPRIPELDIARTEYHYALGHHLFKSSERYWLECGMDSGLLVRDVYYCGKCRHKCYDRDY